MKRVLISIFLVIITILQFAACQTANIPADTTVPNSDDTTTISPDETAPNGETTPQSPEATNPTPEMTEVILNNKDTLYTIISSENAPAEIESIASGFWKSMFTASITNKLKIDVDWVQKIEDADNDNYEILIGDTNRPESAEAKKLLKTYLDYAILVRDNKIAIVANTPERLTAAVDHFNSQLSVTDGTLKYAGMSSIVDIWDKYEYTNMSICGNPISEYTIVLSKDASDSEKNIANELVNIVATKSGVLLNVVDESAPAVEKEIIIGKTSRPETSATIEGGKLMTVGKKLVIVSEKAFYYSSLEKELINMIADKKGIIAEGLDYSVANSALDFFLENTYASGLINEPMNLGVLALLSSCEYFNDRMIYGSKNLGERWVYSVSGKDAAQTGYFDDMLKATKKGANCASPVNWALTEMGIVPKNDRFYGGQTGGFASYSGNAKNYLAPYCEIYDYHSSPISFNKLYKDGKVKVGDIFLCKHHTFIYRGEETFYAAGHDGAWHSDSTAPTNDSKKAVFDNWVLAFNEVAETGKVVSGKYNMDYNYNVYYVVRLKDDYIPEYYRNKDGNVVKNPMTEK